MINKNLFQAGKKKAMRKMSKHWKSVSLALLLALGGGALAGQQNHAHASTVPGATPTTQNINQNQSKQQNKQSTGTDVDNVKVGAQTNNDLEQANNEERQILNYMSHSHSTPTVQQHNISNNNDNNNNNVHVGQDNDVNNQQITNANELEHDGVQFKQVPNLQSLASTIQSAQVQSVASTDNDQDNQLAQTQSTSSASQSTNDDNDDNDTQLASSDADNQSQDTTQSTSEDTNATQSGSQSQMTQDQLKQSSANKKVSSKANTYWNAMHNDHDSIQNLDQQNSHTTGRQNYLNNGKVTDDMNNFANNQNKLINQLKRHPYLSTKNTVNSPYGKISPQTAAMTAALEATPGEQPNAKGAKSADNKHVAFAGDVASNKPTNHKKVAQNKLTHKRGKYYVGGAKEPNKKTANFVQKLETPKKKHVNKANKQSKLVNQLETPKAQPASNTKPATRKHKRAKSVKEPNKATANFVQQLETPKTNNKNLLHGLNKVSKHENKSFSPKAATHIHKTHKSHRK